MCSCCNQAMKWSKDAHLSDGFRWRCNKRSCRTQVSVRDGSFFSKSRLPLQQLVEMLYMWAYGEATVYKCKREFGTSDRTITDWKNFIRDVCMEMVAVRDPCVIGGVGHKVEIDKSLLFQQKYHIGRMFPQIWIFGGIDTTTKEVFVVPVLSRQANLLIPVLQRHVLPGTTIISDLWSAHHRISDFGYIHQTVKHSRNFVDPVTGANINTIQSLWSKVKNRNRMKCGTSHKLLVTYLSEYRWRRKYGTDPFTNIVKHIRSLYMVCDDADPLPPVVVNQNVNPHVAANEVAVEQALVDGFLEENPSSADEEDVDDPPPLHVVADLNFGGNEDEEGVDDPALVLNVVQGAENMPTSSDSALQNLSRGEAVLRRSPGRPRKVARVSRSRPVAADLNFGGNEDEEGVDDSAPILNVVQGAENMPTSSDLALQNLSRPEAVLHRGRGRPRREAGTRRPRRKIY